MCDWEVHETHVEVIDVLFSLGDGHHGGPRLSAVLQLGAEALLAVVA